MSGDTELAVVDEIAGEIATFESLVADDKLDDAIAFAELHKQRLNSVSEEWRARMRELENVLKQRANIKDREKKWKDYDRRIKLLKKHHPDFFELLQETYDRDLVLKLSNWRSRGDERLVCQIVKIERWNGMKSVCGEMTNSQEDFDLHRLRSRHISDEGIEELKQTYRVFRVSFPASVLHKEGGAHDYGSFFEVLDIGGNLTSILGRSSYPYSYLCKQCWKIDTSKGKCGECKGPVDKKGNCVLGC